MFKFTYIPCNNVKIQHYYNVFLSFKINVASKQIKNVIIFRSQDVLQRCNKILNKECSTLLVYVFL
jgi:hypothetical protein